MTLERFYWCDTVTACLYFETLLFPSNIILLSIIFTVLLIIFAVNSWIIAVLAEVLWGRKTHSQVNAVCSQCVRWQVMTSSAHMSSVTRARLCSFFTSQWHWRLCFMKNWQVLRGVCTFCTVIYHTHYGSPTGFLFMKFGSPNKKSRICRALTSTVPGCLL